MFLNALLRTPAKIAQKRSARPVISELILQQDHQRYQRLQNAADEFGEARADEIAHAFHVAHDARDESAALGGVVIGHGEAADVLLHLAAQLRDQALAFLGEQLGERERGDRLDDGGAEDHQHERREQVVLVLIDDVVEYDFRRVGQHHAHADIDQHQQEAESRACRGAA